MKRLWVIGFCVVACAAVAGAERSGPLERSGPPLWSVAPEFALPDEQGRLHRLSERRGRIVVLNFWAFWCDTWKEEMPHLRELAKQETALDFSLVCISVDGTRLEEFRRHVGEKPPFPVLLDQRQQTSNVYRIAHVPTVVILDPRGKVRYVKSGYPGNHAVLSEVRRIFNETKVKRAEKNL